MGNLNGVAKMKVMRTDREVGVVIDKTWEREELGSSVPGMTYEQGVRAGIEWLLGHVDDNPMDD